MKKVITILTLAVFATAYSQVIIGGDTGTATDKTSVLLDFAPNQNKGIILPYVRTVPSGAGLVEGTIILDAQDPNKSYVKYYNGNTTAGTNGWTDLSSGNKADINTALAKQPTATQVTENAEAKAIIGANTTSAEGVLVLESTDKAMVLPMVNSTDDIPNPAPGMLVYLNKAGAKRLAVFNGAKWAYWAPN